jgi:hypothetical protein
MLCLLRADLLDRDETVVYLSVLSLGVRGQHDESGAQSPSTAASKGVFEMW